MRPVDKMSINSNLLRRYEGSQAHVDHRVSPVFSFSILQEVDKEPLLGLLRFNLLNIGCVILDARRVRADRENRPRRLRVPLLERLHARWLKCLGRREDHAVAFREHAG